MGDAAPKALSDRSYQRRAAQLLALIAHGEIKFGERPPSDLALSERFDASCTSKLDHGNFGEVLSVMERFADPITLQSARASARILFHLSCSRGMSAWKAA
ncbi:MAG: hypothetical protein RLZZ371_1796 [Pseudomonadota bacterium]